MNWLSFVPIGCLILVGAPLYASDTWIPSPPTEQIEAYLDRLRAEPAAQAKALAAGRRAAHFCTYCHGETGISATDNIPHLAGQNVFYLLAQIDKFGDGRRNDEFMSGLVRLLKPQDRLHIALFYAHQTVPPTPATNPAQANAGKTRYRRSCQGCHGEQAHGSREIARLAGQRPAYLVSALKAYRSGQRPDLAMKGVLKGLNDSEIEALAVYLASLP